MSAFGGKADIRWHSGALPLVGPPPSSECPAHKKIEPPLATLSLGRKIAGGSKALTVRDRCDGHHFGRAAN
jgi:hypothetical protein